MLTYLLFLFVGYAEPEAAAPLLLLLDELDDVGFCKSVGCATMGGLCDELLDETFTTECGGELWTLTAGEECTLITSSSLSVSFSPACVK